MTLHATRSGQLITIHHNLGVGDARAQHQVTEHASHLRHFHSQLGALLDAAEAEAEQRASAPKPAEHHHDAGHAEPGQDHHGHAAHEHHGHEPAGG
jgi:hypothetical protein